MAVRIILLNVCIWNYEFYNIYTHKNKFPKSEPGQLQKNYATAWKITKDIIWDMVMMRNAGMLMLQFISGWLINFRNMFIYVRK